jgi:hypothetical protein
MKTTCAITLALAVFCIGCNKSQFQVERSEAESLRATCDSVVEFTAACGAVIGLYIGWIQSTSSPENGPFAMLAQDSTVCPYDYFVLSELSRAIRQDTLSSNAGRVEALRSATPIAGLCSNGDLLIARVFNVRNAQSNTGEEQGDQRWEYRFPFMCAVSVWNVQEKKWHLYRIQEVATDTSRSNFVLQCLLDLENSLGTPNAR